MTQQIWVIGNPAAGRGRGAKIIRDVRAALATRPDVTIVETARAGDESELAERAASYGASAVIAVGGDGTWSKVANGLLRSSRRIPLALLAGGTGNDFAKSVRAPARDIGATLRLVDGNITRRVDVGAVEGRHFLVCCGFGFDTAVLERMKTTPLTGSSRYVLASLRELFGYDGFHLADSQEEKLLMLVVANGPHYGGAFVIAPGASVADGLLDVVRVRDVSPWRRPALFMSAARGTHIVSPAVSRDAQSFLVLRFPAAGVYNLDGDLTVAKSSELRIDCIPGALDVFAPSQA